MREREREREREGGRGSEGGRRERGEERGGGGAEGLKFLFKIENTMLHCASPCAELPCVPARTYLFSTSRTRYIELFEGESMSNHRHLNPEDPFPKTL